MYVFDALYTPEELKRSYAGFSDEFPQIFAMVANLQPERITNIVDVERQRLATALIEQCELYLKSVVPGSRADAKTQLILKLQAQAVDFFYGDKSPAQEKVLSEKTRYKVKMTYQELNKIHADEHHYQGNINIYYWLMNIRQGIPCKESFQEVIDKGKQVPYFDVETRQEFKVHFLEGKFHHLNDNKMTPIDTNDILDNQREREGFRLYVIDIHGNFYVDNWKDVIPDLFCHSSFLSGDTVKCAGLIKINQGKLSEISIESGHYRPKPEHLLKILSQLKKAGVDLSTVDVTYKHEEKNKVPWNYRCKADKYLRQKGLALSDNLNTKILPEQNSALYMNGTRTIFSVKQDSVETDPRLEMLLDLQEIMTKVTNTFAKKINAAQYSILQKLSNSFLDTDYNKFSDTKEIHQWAYNLVDKQIPAGNILAILFKKSQFQECRATLLDEIGKLNVKSPLVPQNK